MTGTGRAMPSPARQAFDRLAPSYDALAGGEIFRLLRERTHRVLERTFRPGCRVLEVGCGTGLDTVFLAERGVRVLACDPAEGMVCAATRRLAQEALDGRATVMACGLDDLAAYLDALHAEPGFDGLVSNFGALNCVSDLKPLGRLAARHIRPGGVLILGVMGRHCAWETVYFAATGRPHLGQRRRGEPPVDVPVAGIGVPTFYHRVSELCAALGGDVPLTAITGIGVMIPPPYLESRWQRLPRLARGACVAVDRLLAPCPPFNRLGDHVLLQFTKRRGSHA